MRRTTSLIAASALVGALALPVAAQERYFNFTLRGGVEGGPAYPGSDDFEARPDAAFRFGVLRWGAFNVGNDGAVRDGFAFGGSFRVVGDRDSSDHAELAGLEDIDTAVELGFGIVFRQRNWEVFGEMRKGFGGHTGVVGTIGSDYVFKPDNRWTVRAGPRINFGNSEYANTYFGVPTATANFGAFEADGGVLGAGFTVEATYDITDTWAIEGAVGYEKLLGDAQDSPITIAGDDDQWTIRLGVSRKFSLRF